ncbi:hypothetical protein ACH9EU_00955 [Kocuria sp. M1R5S2]|uniref:hypothetical protein n=1 Tax=Kocuria rhizosphaerae TaxID=3376285 RepID=UPI0037894AEF
MILATSTTELRHTVRLVHASTGKPVRGLGARLEPAPHGWSLRVASGVVVVAARADLTDPSSPPTAVLTLTDGALAGVLVVPPLPGRPPRTVEVPLTAAELEVALHPVPMTLSAVLTRASDGAPRTGAVVVARATSGPSPRPEVPLPEADPGIYRSAAVEWTAELTPLDLLVDGSPLRTLTVDFTAGATRVHLVDTT